MSKNSKNTNALAHDTADWSRGARIESLRAYFPLERRRLIRANQEYLQGLLAQSMTQTGYYGTSRPLNPATRDVPFTNVFENVSRSLYAWPAAVALEALKDVRHMVGRGNLSDPSEGRVVELELSSPRPDPTGSLRWVADTETTRIRQVFILEEEFRSYIAEKAAQEPQNYDGRDLLGLRDL